MNSPATRHFSAACLGLLSRLRGGCGTLVRDVAAEVRNAWRAEPLLVAACGVEAGVGVVAVVWLCILSPGLPTTTRGDLPNPEDLITAWNEQAYTQAMFDADADDPFAWLDREDLPDLALYEWAWFAFPDDVEAFWLEWSREDGEDVLHWTRLAWRAQDIGDAELYAFCRRQEWRCREQWRFDR